MVKKCAEKMGWTVEEFGSDEGRKYRVRDSDGDFIYGIGHNWIASKWNPLHYDAQAFQLVERLKLEIVYPNGRDKSRAHVSSGSTVAKSKDLRRAIVECVSKL